MDIFGSWNASILSGLRCQREPKKYNTTHKKFPEQSAERRAIKLLPSILSYPQRHKIDQQDIIGTKN